MHSAAFCIPYKPLLLVTPPKAERSAAQRSDKRSAVLKAATAAENGAARHFTAQNAPHFCRKTQLQKKRCEGGDGRRKSRRLSGGVPPPEREERRVPPGLRKPGGEAGEQHHRPVRSS